MSKEHPNKAAYRAQYGTWKCQECNLIFETRAKLHEHNRSIHQTRARRSWNKGLTKETSISIANASKKVSEGVQRAYTEGRLTGRCKDSVKEELRKKKISETMKTNPNAGGKREGSGRGLQGWYKGYYCDSSWELAVVIYWLDHNIQFSRCKETFNYTFEGSTHTYHPDFVLKTSEYVEVKGAEKTDQWKAKLEQFPKDKILNVIGKNQIEQYLSYVIEKYGKDFVNLYEKKRVKKMKMESYKGNWHPSDLENLDT